jgi:PAS domain S-box-containing protein
MDDGARPVSPCRDADSAKGVEMGDSGATLDEALPADPGSAGPDSSPGREAQSFTPSGFELLELVADGIVSADEEGRIILFNKAAETLFGYSRAEVLGRPVEILLPQRARDSHREAVAAFAASSEAGNRMLGPRREVTGRRKDGGEFPVEASLSRRQSGGRVVLTVAIRDVTARKLAEEQRQILSRELAHHFKNMMAVVTSILSLTARHAPEAPRERTERRRFRHRAHPPPARSRGPNRISERGAPGLAADCTEQVTAAAMTNFQPADP